MNGRKRHLLVDTTGLVLSVVVHEASLTDRDGARRVLEACPAPARRQLQHLWVDAGYQGDGMRALAEHRGWIVQIVRWPRRWYLDAAWWGTAPPAPSLDRGPYLCLARTLATLE